MFQRKYVPVFFSYQVLASVSRCYPWSKGRLSTCYWAFRRWSEDPLTCMANSDSNSSNLPQDQRELVVAKIVLKEFFYPLLNLTLFIHHTESYWLSTHKFSSEDFVNLPHKSMILWKYFIYKLCYLFFLFLFSFFIFLRCHFHLIWPFFFHLLLLLFIVWIWKLNHFL